MKRNGIFRRCLALLLAAVIALAPGASALAERNDTAFCATPGCVLAAGHEGDCRVFDCSFEPHSHTDACYNADGALICGRSEQVLHTHDDACCNAAGELVCGLPELAVHTHTDSCYTERQVLTCELPAGHTHDDTCYEPKQGELTCDIPESEEHSHGAECYAAERGELLCDIPESEGHTHGDGCYVTERELSCGLPEIAAHTHTAGALTCGLLQPAAHQHGEECFRTVEPAEALDPVSTAAEDEEVPDSAAEFAYVNAFSIGKVIDGSEPFDQTGAISAGVVDHPGNDNGNSNSVVRSFDSVEYDLQLTIGTSRDDVTLTKVPIGFELSLYKGATAAEFNTQDMSWLQEDWKIEYLDAEGEVILVKDSTGLYEWDTATNDKGSPTTLNSFVNGSDHANPYMVNNGIVQQKLTGSYTIEKEGGDSLAGAQQTLTAFINVLAAANGETFEPSFKVWVIGNEDNTGAPKPGVNEIKVKTGDSETDRYVVTVSAAARYNVLVKNSGATNHLGYFDFATGQKVSAASDTAAYGRMLYWGITLQLYNETDSAAEGALVAKGYRGIELPVNGIEFDLTLTASVKGDGNGKDLTQQYDFSPYLWDYHANDTASAGTWGRNLYWGNNDRTRYAKSVAPYNNSATARKPYGSGTYFCYNGGDWRLTGYTAGGVPHDGADPTDASSVAGNGAGTVYHFAVSGYDFDFDDFLRQFPSSASGDSGNASFLSPPAYSFSAGHIQVLQRFDQDYDGAFTAYVKAAVSNLRAKSKTNQQAQEVKTTDNSDGLSVVQYSTGNYAKYISLTDRAANDNATKAN